MSKKNDFFLIAIICARANIGNYSFDWRAMSTKPKPLALPTGHYEEVQSGIYDRQNVTHD